MKFDEEILSNSAIRTSDARKINDLASTPSPVLAEFLELIGRALAQEWIEQSSNATDHARHANAISPSPHIID